VIGFSPVAAQELPTIPVAVCKGGGDGKGTFTATTKLGEPIETRRLPETGTLEPVTTAEPVVIDLPQLSAAFVSGDWPAANAKATALLGKIRTCLAQELAASAEAGNTPDRRQPTSPTAIFDLNKDYVHLLWIGTIPAATDSTIFSMLVHSPALPPYSRVLPGLSNDKAPRLYEVFLSENVSASISSYYVSKPLPDPLLDQVPQVVEKFLGPMFTFFDRLEPVGRTLTNVKEVTERHIAFVVKQVKLPEPRAGVEVTMRAALPITQTQFRSELTSLALGLEAQGLSNASTSATSTALMELLKLTGDPENVHCGKKGSLPACKRAMHQQVTAAFAPERPKFPTDPPRRDLDRLEAAFRTFVDGLKPGAVSGKASLDNSPLTHLTFGILSSYAFKVGGNDVRAKVEGGKVVNAPMPRTLQMVVLNISPWGYQSKTIKRWIRRAFVQPFVGVVFSPDLGVAGGVSFKVLSNIGVNFGYAHSFITRPKNGLTFGAVLDEKLKGADGKDTEAFKYSDDLRRDPLQRGKLHSLFFGVSYNFK
jgi:hypothetical protein